MGSCPTVCYCATRMMARDSAQRFTDGRALFDGGQLAITDGDGSLRTANRPGWRSSAPTHHAIDFVDSCNLVFSIYPLVNGRISKSRRRIHGFSTACRLTYYRISRGRSVGLVSSKEMEYASRRDSQNTASTALLHVPGGVHRTSWRDGAVVLFSFPSFQPWPDIWVRTRS